MSDTPASSPERVECPATKDPAVRLFILAGMLIAFGAYCFIDGYVLDKYPHKSLSEDINVWANWALNHYGPFVLIPPGILFAVWGVVFLRRKLVADANGIGYAGRQQIAWDKIEKLDASRLASKGILELYYGTAKPLKLDSWKLRNFKPLVAFVESHTSAETETTPKT